MSLFLFSHSPPLRVSNCLCLFLYHSPHYISLLAISLAFKPSHVLQTFRPLPFSPLRSLPRSLPYRYQILRCLEVPLSRLSSQPPAPSLPFFAIILPSPPIHYPPSHSSTPNPNPIATSPPIQTQSSRPFFTACATPFLPFAQLSILCSHACKRIRHLISGFVLLCPLFFFFSFFFSSFRFTFYSLSFRLSWGSPPV